MSLVAQGFIRIENIEGLRYLWSPHYSCHQYFSVPQMDSDSICSRHYQYQNLKINYVIFNVSFCRGHFHEEKVQCRDMNNSYAEITSSVWSNPVGKNLFKVRNITLEQRSLNVVLTLFCWLWTGFCLLGHCMSLFLLSII